MCEARRAEGLPALSIQWGVIGHVGFVEEAMQASSFTKSNAFALAILALLVQTTLLLHQTHAKLPWSNAV